MMYLAIAPQAGLLVSGRRQRLKNTVSIPSRRQAAGLLRPVSELSKDWVEEYRAKVKRRRK